MMRKGRNKNRHESREGRRRQTQEASEEELNEAGVR